MTLGILYHTPFWRLPDGRLCEREGSFARYVDSLAPYVDEISLCVPLVADPLVDGSTIRSSNVTVAPLPSFDGPAQFYLRAGLMLPALAAWVRRLDLLHCRVPSPAAVFAFAIGRLIHRPSFVLVVGDLRALIPSVPYRGVKRLLWRAYTEFEERNVQFMVDRALTFANGPALAAKHNGPRAHVIETTTTTISARDIASRTDACARRPVRALTVSRIDPRKNLRVLPRAVARLVSRGVDLTLDIVGPTVGRPGEAERTAIRDEAARSGVDGRVSLRGGIPLDQLLPALAGYDLFVLPTLPGEGIPRVLLEAMSAGLPVVTTNVSGIPGLVTHGVNGWLVDDPTPDAVADAMSTVIDDAPLRLRMIANGYETARAHTLETQAARMMSAVSSALNVPLRTPIVLPVA